MKLRKVTVLIRKDVSDIHEDFEVQKSNKPDNQLQALHGQLGWVITGTIRGLQKHRDISVNFVTCEKNLHDQVEKFWKVEGFGTKSTLKAETKGDTDCKCWEYNLFREDMQAVDILNKTTTLNDEDHYVMGLLWRRDDDDDSYQITEGKPA